MKDRNWMIAAMVAVAAISLAAVVLVRMRPPASTETPPPAAPEAPPAAEPAAVPEPAKGPAATEGAAPGEWTMDLAAAKALAAETGRPLFLNFTGSDWCGWCRLMDKQVFSHGDWQAYAKERLVLVWIDFPRDKSLVPEALVPQNDQLLREFEVGGFPTYVLLDSDGQTRLGQTGASRDATPKSFIETLDNLLLVSDMSIAALREQMTDEQKAELDETRAAVAMARQKLDDWVAGDPEQTEENMALFIGMREEIGHAEEALLQLLKGAKAPAAAPLDAEDGSELLPEQ
jgi:thiol-disulfide isomerase/thioredoxin